MAIITRDFRAAGLPKMDAGAAYLSGFRHDLQYHSEVELVAGDILRVWGLVPTGEYWQIRNIAVNDNTKVPGSFGQGWQQQSIHTQGSGHVITANAATPKPSGEFLDAPGAIRVIWDRTWDGATYLTWRDQFGGFLVVGDANPVLNVSLLLPRTEFLISSNFCEFDSGPPAGEKGFTVTLTVDRFLAPLDELERNPKLERDLMKRALQLSGSDALIR